MKNLKRQDRNGTRTTTDIERKYKLGQIDYTAEEIERLKMELTVDSSLSASSSNAVANSVITQALNNKVNKETGKGLSTNDFTDELLDKVNNMESTGDTLPIGAVIEWDSDTIPENWLLLDGQAVSRTEYSELFKLYGTRYGAGDGSTTFNLPNRKTRVSVGKDSTDSDFNTLGKTGGEKAHKLTISEIPNHRHGLYNYNANGSNLTESSSVMLGQTATGWSGNGFTTYEGGGAAHNNLQPYFVTNFIVKAKQGNITSENVEEVTRQILLDVYPVGSIYMSVSPTNPSTLFGGTWEAWGTGRVPVGIDTTQTEFATVEQTGGEKAHTLTVDEMPEHSHLVGYSDDNWKINNDSTAQNRAVIYHDANVETSKSGGNQAHNNLQPYITCYMWKRVS